MADVNIFLFVPNLIGYARIVLGILSLFLMPTRPAAAGIFYFLSAFADAFDGYAARAYNQSTRFGAMLDQLTDRLAFLGLLMTLAAFYPKWLFAFQLVAIIDIGSHWLHLHVVDLTGRTTHKESNNPILHYYYTSKPFLFFMCLGNEAFFSFLYLLAFGSGPCLGPICLLPLLTILTFPIAVVKVGISLVHLVTASQDLGAHDVQQRIKSN